MPLSPPPIKEIWKLDASGRLASPAWILWLKNVTSDQSLTQILIQSEEITIKYAEDASVQTFLLEPTSTSSIVERVSGEGVFDEGILYATHMEPISAGSRHDDLPGYLALLETGTVSTVADDPLVYATHSESATVSSTPDESQSILTWLSL